MLRDSTARKRLNENSHILWELIASGNELWSGFRLSGLVGEFSFGHCCIQSLFCCEISVRILYVWVGGCVTMQILSLEASFKARLYESQNTSRMCPWLQRNSIKSYCSVECLDLWMRNSYQHNWWSQIKLNTAVFVHTDFFLYVGGCVKKRSSLVLWFWTS